MAVYSNNKCVVIPAAGASTRLGQPKQLVKFEGNALIRLAAEAALEVSPSVIVVVGCEAAAVRNEIADLPVVVVENPDWEKGMGKSISVGVRSAIDRFPTVDGILIHLCDMPLINGNHLRKLITEHSGSNCDLVYTEYSNIEGAPALFGRRFFAELLEVTGDRGARELIDQCHDSKKKPVKFAGTYADVDRPGDLLHIESETH